MHQYKRGDVLKLRIIFVRHGHPDYEKDCLTELGHKQAEAMTKRLSDEKIDCIYSSSLGRALETAQHLADARGMNVTLCDFMREVRSGSINGEEIPHNGQPWRVVDDMIASGISLLDEDWENKYFSNNTVLSHFKRCNDGFDKFLEELGYKREGCYYRVLKKNSKNIVMVSHGGSSSSVIAHIFNLPSPFVFGTMRSLFTGITIASFDGEESSLISPKFEIANDSRHIDAIENVFGF